MLLKEVQMITLIMIDDNNYVNQFFGDSSDESDNYNADNQEIRHA